MSFKDEVLTYLGKSRLCEEFDVKKDNYEGDECHSKKEKPKGHKEFLPGELTPEEIEMINLFRKKNNKKPLSAVEDNSKELPDDHTNGRNGSVKTGKCPDCGKKNCQCSDETEEGAESASNEAEETTASVKTKKKSAYSCFNY